MCIPKLYKVKFSVLRICKILYGLFICMCTYPAYSQITTGGNIGLNIVNNVIIVDLSPEIGYSFVEPVLVGVSPFILYAQHLQTGTKEVLYGARAFGEYKHQIGAFAHAEYEISKLWVTEGVQKAVHAAPVGGGFESPLGNNTVAYIMVLYDILYKEGISYKQNPIIRAGIRHSL